MMQKFKLALAAAALISALPLLQGCVPAVVGAGAAAGVMTAHDRRTTGTQADDEGLEWKAAQQIPENYKNDAHVNITAFNRRLLITGEVPSEEARNVIGERVGKLEGVKEVFNETVVGAASSLSSRTNDSYVTSKVKARLVDEKTISANHVKVVTEAGVVYLMGIVTEREGKVAVAVTRTTAGVRKVVNLTEVISDAEAKRLQTLPSAGTAPPSQPAPVENR
ncbi:MAG: BON domain-containing protein [Azonexus sp.]|nr:BON domain-containing protein [Azonexus sp.]